VRLPGAVVRSRVASPALLPAASVRPLVHQFLGHSRQRPIAWRRGGSCVGLGAWSLQHLPAYVTPPSAMVSQHCVQVIDYDTTVRRLGQEEDQWRRHARAEPSGRGNGWRASLQAHGRGGRAWVTPIEPHTLRASDSRRSSAAQHAFYRDDRRSPGVACHAVTSAAPTHVCVVERRDDRRGSAVQPERRPRRVRPSAAGKQDRVGGVAGGTNTVAPLGARHPSLTSIDDAGPDRAPSHAPG
jgi:hypothetical protein